MGPGASPSLAGESLGQPPWPGASGHPPWGQKQPAHLVHLLVNHKWGIGTFLSLVAPALN